MSAMRYDIEAARKARVASAAVTWGLNTEAILRSCGPDLVAVDPTMLRTLIENGRAPPSPPPEFLPSISHNYRSDS